MALEFMTGATVFALINLLIALIVIYLVYRIAKKIIIDSNTENENETQSIKSEVIMLGILTIVAVFFGSVAQPKLKIDVPENRALIEYQDQAQEIVIETPPPRTEKLEGFTPLKD